jgi:integrase
MAIALAFTERALRDLPLAASGIEEYTDKTLPYWRLRIGARDRTLYVVRKQRGTGRLVYVRLGAFGDKPLATYKAEAEHAAAELAAGRDPRAPKAAKGDVLTLDAALTQYLEAKGKALAPATVRSYRSDFDQTFDSWRSWPLAAITADMVLRRHHERRADSPTRADGALRVLRAVYRYALGAAAADGKPLALPDPLAKVRLARAMKATPRRSTYLDNGTRAAWLAAVRALPDDDGQARTGTARDALLLLIATGLRLREGLRLRWDEVDLARGLLRLSGKRMKGGREHVLPLGKRTLALLALRRKADPAGAFVFPGAIDGAPLDRISQWVFDRIEVAATPHDLRRTCATWLGTHAPGYVVKQVLSHADPEKSADVTVGYVQRDLDALRVWLQRWEDALYAKARR